MSFERDIFETMMPSTMSVYSFTAFDTYGDPSYSTSVTTYRCRMEYTPTIIGNQLGEEVVSNVTAYVGSTSPLNVLDRYILPDGSTGIVQSIMQQWDDEGIHHHVINFGGAPGG